MRSRSVFSPRRSPNWAGRPRSGIDRH
jgi:hypothetical protein